MHGKLRGFLCSRLNKLQPNCSGHHYFDCHYRPTDPISLAVGLLQPGGLLTSLRGSTYRPEYDSPLLSLRPSWTAFLNSLRGISIRSVTVRIDLLEGERRGCQPTARSYF